MTAIQTLLSKWMLSESSFQKEWYSHTTLFTMTAIHTLLLKWMLSTHFFQNGCYHKTIFSHLLLLPSSSFRVNAIHIFLSKWLLYILSQWLLSTKELLMKWLLSVAFLSINSKNVDKNWMVLVALRSAMCKSTARKFVLKQHFSLSFSGTITRN